MKRKFVAHLGVSLAVCLIIISAGCANARSITIEGVVTYDDNGEPAADNEIIFTQLHGLWFAEPKTLGEIVTDASGRFHLEVPKVKGTVDLRVPVLPCDHSGAVAQIDVESIEDGDVVEIDLSLKRDRCL